MVIDGSDMKWDRRRYSDETQKLYQETTECLFMNAVFSLIALTQDFKTVIFFGRTLH